MNGPVAHRLAFYQSLGTQVPCTAICIMMCKPAPGQIRVELKAPSEHLQHDLFTLSLLGMVLSWARKPIACPLLGDE